MFSSVRSKLWLTLVVVIVSLLHLFPIYETPFEIFIRGRAKANQEEFQDLLDRAQDKVDEGECRSLFLALKEMGDAEKIDYSKYFTDLNLLDVKNLKRRNRILLNHLLQEPKSVFKQGLDLKGGVSFTLEIEEKAFANKTSWERNQLVNKAIDVIGNRIDALGVTEPIIRQRGENKIEVQLPGVSTKDNPEVIHVLKKPAKLEFRLARPYYNGSVDSGYEILVLEKENKKTGKIEEIKWLAKKIPEMTGKMVKSAVPIINSYGNYEISLKMTKEGTSRFSKITKKNINRHLAIVLDGKIYSAPVIQSEIPSGQASVSGDFNQREAIELSNVLNNPLEFELNVVEMFEIGPSLAQDVKVIAWQGAWIASFIVALFMYWYYKGPASFGPGLVSIVGILINFILILAAWSAIGATITLPSITAMVLTFGMAVDANILSFERVKEELRAGKHHYVAVNLGYKKAFVTIIDSNLTTLLAALLLIWLGTGPVKGFGVTLTIGIFTTMFTTLVVSKALVEGLVHKHIIGFREKCIFSDRSFDFLKYRKLAVISSLIVIIIGTIAFFVRGKKVYGIDFLGGDEIRLAYGRSLKIKEIENLASDKDLGEIVPVYQSVVGEHERLDLLSIQTEEGKGLMVYEALKQEFPDANFDLVSQSKIGASVGEDIMWSAIISVIAAIIGILLYVALRFEFGYGIGSIVAILHDILVTIGVYVLMGRQFTAPMVAAILMTIGYSINDTIVVFDRVREELALRPNMKLYELINLALNKTFSRTLMTSITTFLAASVMYMYCAGVVSDYALIFLIGIVSGTFSSIFIAIPVFYWWHRGDRRKVEYLHDKMPVYDWNK